MRFLIDAQLPPALARYIIKQGYQAEHVAEANLLSASDEVIWAYALEHDMIVVSKDEDFAHRQSQGGSSPAILWLRMGNCRSEELIRRIDHLFPQIVAFFQDGDRLVEIR